MNTTGKLKVITPHNQEFTQVIELDQLDFPRPWKQQEWESLNWDHHVLLGLSVESRLQGYALFSQAPGDDTAHLLKICVASSKRGSGVTQEFWAQCLENLRSRGITSIYLEVESPNHRAISFYQKAGFQLLRRIKAYYSDGTDAVTMQVTI